ncbi:transcriptional regulator [Rhizobium sp. Root1220]|uniref:transcriptional regulator n=1 Tax=Rhizobium sp. Root1220 TaxID=1736432 RepID=UPI000A6D1510|nr:transcriptional regulator [Rhizobium sp. Root1220]
MKRPQKEFVVEYKGGSRRKAQKPSSIWGNLDLQSISRDVEAEAQSEMVAQAMRISLRHSERQQNETKLLTPATGQRKTSLPPQEGHMAEETSTVVSPDSVSTDVVPAAPEKKRRGPRPKSASLDAATAGALAATTEITKATRKPRVKRTKAAPSASQTTPPEKKPRKMLTPQPTVEAKSPAAAGDEMADLLQLEEENRSLRKQLAEKLRAENADLRKRLGQS